MKRVLAALSGSCSRHKKGVAARSIVRVFGVQRNVSSSSSPSSSSTVRVDRHDASGAASASAAAANSSSASSQGPSQQSPQQESRRRVPQDGLKLEDFVQQRSQLVPPTVANTSSTTPTATTTATSTPTASATRKTHSFHIKTYGCQMNVNDSDIVRAVLLQQGGFVESPTEEAADIWLTNTCAIRDKAEQKVFQRLRALRKRKKGRVVGLLGCMAERLQEELLEDQMADLVVGPDAYRALPQLLDDLLTPEHAASTAIDVTLSLDETYEDIFPVRDTQSLSSSSSSSTPSFSAFCSIQRGCSNRCSFCIVPFTRGQERSRPLDSIVAEVEQLVEEQQLKEVTLLGQNVNSYHDRSDAAMMARPLASTPGLSNPGFRNRIRRPTQGGYTFVDLVERIADISPELRVRFTSPHPKDYPTELLHCMAERPNVCAQLHMPAQSGSTTMLTRMKRGYSRDAYLELIDSVHAIIPDIALSSDFIAGFCGETDQEHADTVSLLKEVEYDQAFLFAYSLREKTHAHRALDDNVPPHIKQARLQELIDTFRTHVHAKNERLEVGKLRLVLVEGAAKRQPTANNSNQNNGDSPLNLNLMTWHGRTDQNKRILFPIMTDTSGGAQTVPEALAIATLASSVAMDSLPGAGQHPSTTTSLVPGEYAVVEVTEAKGHTLRGRLLWKTTLSKFAALEAATLSKLGSEELVAFQQTMHQY